MYVGNRVCVLEFNLCIPHIIMFEKSYVVMKLAKNKIIHEGRQNPCQLNRWNVSLQNKIDLIF